MPDRRQKDRRESTGFQGKQLNISLSTFISIVVVFSVISLSIIICTVVGKTSYDKGYEQALTDTLILSIPEEDIIPEENIIPELNSSDSIELDLNLVEN